MVKRVDLDANVRRGLTHRQELIQLLSIDPVAVARPERLQPSLRNPVVDRLATHPCNGCCLLNAHPAVASG